MQSENFDAVMENRILQIRRVLGLKATEYARGDRLSNFKKAAKLVNCTPEKALSGFVAKHIIALMDFIDDIDKGIVQTQDRWDEKIGDIINYMILLEALVTERSGDKEEKPMLKKKIRAYCSHAIRGHAGDKCPEEQRDFNKAKAIEWGKKLWLYFGSQLELYIPGANDDWAVVGLEKGYLTIDQVLDIDCSIVEGCDVLLIMDWEGISGGMGREIDAANKSGIPTRVITGVDEIELKALKIWLERL